jgi:hypothetical protein
MDEDRCWTFGCLCHLIAFVHCSGRCLFCKVESTAMEYKFAWAKHQISSMFGVSNKTAVVDSSVSMFFFYILGIHSFEMYGVVVQKWRLQTCFQNSTKKSYYDVWWLFACPFWDNSWQLHLLVQQQKGFLDVISSGFMVSKRKIYSVSRGVPK